MTDREQLAEDVLGKRKLPEVEKRALEVGIRLVHYQAIRKREVRTVVEPLLVMPHPSSPAYLAFIGKTVEKARESRASAGSAGTQPTERRSRSPTRA